MKRGRLKTHDFYRERVNSQLMRFFDSIQSTSSSKDRLKDIMKYSALASGKRFRPILTYTVASLYDVAIEKVDSCACAIELIHIYSLIHDDLPAMDDDDIRHNQPTSHKVYGEAQAILAGDALLTLAFEILSDKSLILKEKTKVKLINLISECSGHSGIAGGQYLDLNYERKKISKKKIIDMQIKKTGKLFAFCCIAPALISNKNKSVLRFFEKIGYEIGLLFQITDDLIDYKGISKKAGKKTKKDKKKGKATLISLLGYKNTIKYAHKIILKINNKLKKYGSKSKNLSETLEYILNRNK